MKHLSDLSLAACFEGERPSPRDAAHLRACRECRETLDALRALGRDLAAAPRPPKALRQATLERLGLGAPRRALWAAPRWAAFLAGVLALAWILPLPKFQLPAPLLPAPGPPAPVRPATMLALASHRRESRGRARHRSAVEIEVARAIVAPQTVARVQVGTPEALIQGASAVGGVAESETSSTATKGVEVPLSPGGPAQAALSLDSIRGNLIRPGQGQGLRFTVTLGQNGPLRVLAVDKQGRSVATLFDGDAGPGSLDLGWDGGSAPSGAYTILVQAGGAAKTFSALVVR